MPARPKHVSYESSRHGRPKAFVRRYGRRVRVLEPPGTPAFLRAVADALERLEAVRLVPRPDRPINGRVARPGSFGELCQDYFGSVEFLALDATSQRNRRRILESIMREVHDGRAMRDFPLQLVTPDRIRALRDVRRDKKGAANNRLKYLSAMFGWAIDNGRAKLKTNPCRDVRRLRYATGGFHAWTREEVRQFEEHHPVGTKARLALALLMFLGVRRGDVVRLKSDSIRDGVISFVPQKTRRLRQVESHKPILPELAAVIAKSPFGLDTILETERGKQFTAAGFGNWFRVRCNEAKLPHCTAHGLRKAGATIAAENGASVHQLMAIFDWTTIAQAEPYTRNADRRKIAGEAMKLITRTR